MGLGFPTTPRYRGISKTAARQEEFQKALQSVPLETLRQFRDGKELEQVVTQLQRNGITTVHRDNEEFTNKIFRRIADCINKITDLPGRDEILARVNIMHPSKGPPRTDPNAGMPVALGSPQIARYEDLSIKGTLPACAGDLTNARCMQYPDADLAAESNNSDNEMFAQAPNAATKRRQQSQDESSESGKESINLLTEEGQEWRERTMIFFVPPIIAMEDIKRFISVHVDPTSWMHRGLEMYSYKENNGYLHERVIRLTNTNDVIRELEIQFTDITTVMTHNFTATSVNPDDPGIIPQAADEKAEERAKNMMIMQLKGSCPKNDQAIEFLARTISTSSTVHGITETFMNFLFSSNPQRPLAPNASA